MSDSSRAAAPASSAPLDDPRVRAEVVALLYGNAVVGVFMNLISVPLVWLAYRHSLAPLVLLPFLSLWAAIQGLSAWNQRQWRRVPEAQKRDASTSSRFLQRARWMACLLGLGIAALLAVLHFAAAPATPALAATLALIYVLGACTSTLIYEPQVRTFSFIVLGSQAALLAYSGGTIEWLLAGLMIGLIVGLILYARRYSAQLQQVIVLRFEVQDLLAEQARLKEAAEAANQAKSQFFAAASHDVRQPLQAVMLTFHALRHAKDEARRHQLLDTTERNLGALRQLFDQVLDISRIDAGALLIKPQTIALQPLLEKLDARFSTEAAAKHVWLRFAPTSALIQSDPDALERILANLVGNAIKHTEHGGVWVGLRSERGRIEVRDSGIGIASEHHARIFEEFFQIGNPGRDRTSGLGLGLSIVKRLCELLNHPLGLVSAPGRGSLFWIGVGRGVTPTASTAIDSALSAAAPPASPDPTPLVGRHVFLIENDAQVALSLTDLLRSGGATVSSFESAQAALAAADLGSAADLVITDYRLGEAIDGAELLLRLRSVWRRETCAMVLTGDTETGSLAHINATLGTASGVQRSRLMHKPVTADQLIGAASELLSAS